MPSKPCFGFTVLQDPHPGNVILVRGRDGAPHIGLIDYGSTKQLSKGQRHLFCKIVIALAEDNTAEIATLMKRAGFRSEKMDPQVIYLYTKVGCVCFCVK